MQAENFVFGAQYLRGMTPKRRDWDRDMAAMKAKGFNTLRAWLVWGVLEPKEGEIDFAYIEEYLDLAAKHGLKSGLLFHLHGAPEWAVAKHKSYWYVDEEGRPFEPSPRPNTPSGGWPGLCPDNKEVQALEERFIAPVVKRFGEHPALAFWEPINEPHMWVDFTKNPNFCFCFCEASRAEFVEWLKVKYKELGAIEEAWGRRISRWEELRPPTWRTSFADWCDWRDFSADRIAFLVARRADLIRRHSPRPVIGHAWGGGAVTCASLGAMAFDDWRNSKALDQWGCSAFPSKFDDSLALGLGIDATRAAAGGKIFWQSELGTGDYGCAFDKDARKSPELLKFWCWESLRRGVRGLLFWQYRKELHGFESGTYGFTGYDGEDTPNLLAAAEVGRVLNENADFFNRSNVVPGEVGLLFSFQTYIMEWAQRKDSRLSIDSLSGYYRMFWEASIPVEIVHEDFCAIEELMKFKLLVLPCPLAPSAKIRPLLKEYVKRGGVLLSDPCLCAYDAAKNHDVKVPGDGFAEIFGCHERHVGSAAGRSVKLVFGAREGRLEGGHFQESFTADSNARVLAKYEDGSAAMVEASHGEGRAIIAGLNLGLAHSLRVGVGDDIKRDDAASSNVFAKEIVLKIAAEASVTAPLTADNGVVGSVLNDGGGRRVLIAMNSRYEASKSEIEFADFRCVEAKDLSSGLRIAARDGKLNLEFSPLECKALELTTE